MSGKDTQTEIEGERDDDATGVPHGDHAGDQDPKGLPDGKRQDSETAPRT